MEYIVEDLYIRKFDDFSILRRRQRVGFTWFFEGLVRALPSFEGFEATSGVFFLAYRAPTRVLCRAYKGFSMVVLQGLQMVQYAPVLEGWWAVKSYT